MQLEPLRFDKSHLAHDPLVSYLRERFADNASKDLKRSFAKLIFDDRAVGRSKKRKDDEDEPPQLKPIVPGM
jgi:hypothetical protein